jgi:ABC-type nitrate/sulfonate/bicarbonate transport system substrate-binding protein
MTAATKSARKVDTIWYTRCPVPTAFSLVLQNGLLAEEFAADGIAVKSLQQVQDRKIRESHFNHSLEDSFRYGGNIPPIWARSEGADTRLIGLAWIDAPHVILSLPESGIRDVSDLKGRRLSLPRRVNDQIDFWRAGALRTYEVALATAGLTLDDVELVDVPIEQTFIDGSSGSGITTSLFSSGRRRAALSGDLLALVRGEVDAIFSESSFSTHLRKFLGARVVYNVHEHPDPVARHNNAIPQAFTVSASLVRDRPDLVARVVARTLEAAHLARANREEVIRITALEAGVSEEVADYTYPALETQLGTDLSPENVEALRRRKQFLLSHGFIRKDFDLSAWIDPGPLEAAHAILKAKHGDAFFGQPAAKPLRKGSPVPA